MKYRQIFACLTLFALLLELSDSSTNFIRINIGLPSLAGQNTGSGFNVVKAILDFDGKQGSQDQDEDNSDSDTAHFDDLSVHSSFLATNFVFDSDLVRSSHFLAFVEVLTDQYYPSIFQPPKIA